MEKELSYDEFICFLLIYTSHEDLDFGDEEKAYILARFDKETYQRMVELFLSKSEFGALQVILDHKEIYCKTESDKLRVLNFTKEIFMADGEYSKLEKGLFNFLNHLL